MSSNYEFHAAIQDFHAARQRAGMEEVLARISGKSNELLSYEEVARKLKLRGRSDAGIKSIPVDAIIGSVGRYTDFTRTFLPRSDDDRERWARVKAALMDPNQILPPIEVYKVGEVYFVQDGNHRVSIARQEGFKTIEAHVIEVKTPITLTPDVSPDDLIIKAEYAEFLDTTKIMDLRPNVDLSVSIPGQYEILMAQIYLQKFILVEDKKLNASLQDAVEVWYDTIYIPLAEAIRDRGLLQWFPNRTLTDLYIWISENRNELEKELGWKIESEIAATDLILERSVKSEPGSWRKARTASRYTDRLFADILVPLSGTPESWDALDQAIIIAQRENAKVHGLHTVNSEAESESENAQAVKEHFDQTCQEQGVDGSLAINIGNITQRIIERAVVTDLIVLKIVNPPAAGVSSLISPFRAIVENASRPLVAVPAKATHFKRALLAYDGSERAKEALFVATYFAEIWKTNLLVFTAVEGSKVKADVQDYVKRYLEIHEVEAEYLLSEHGAMDELQKTTEERQVDVVLMGSHGGTMLQQVFVGSAVDYMLRESKIPTLICR